MKVARQAHKTMGELKAEMKAKETISLRQRTELKKKFMRTLEAEMQTLSTEMKQILCDDLATAFHNRLIVLAEAKQ